MKTINQNINDDSDNEDNVSVVTTGSEKILKWTLMLMHKEM